MKFVIFGDIHYKETPPAMRKDGYGEQILDKIKFLQDLARKLDAKIICTGDMFDKKYGTSLREINKMMSVIDKSLGWYFVCGNHDIQAYNQMFETQPIGILMKAGKIKLLNSEPIELSDGVFLTGEGYHVDYDSEDTYSVSVDDIGCRVHIHVTHGMVVEKPVPWEHVLAEDVDGVLQCDFLFNGHNHSPYQYGERIFNIGGLSRIAKDKNYLNKIPKAVVFNTDSKKTKWIDVPCEDDVWRGDIEKRVTANQDEINEFVREMKEMDIADEDIIESLLDGESEAVRKMFYSYIGE